MESESSKQFPRIGKEEPPLEEGYIMSLILALRGLKPVEDESIVVKRQEVAIEDIVEEIRSILETDGKIDFLKFLKEKNDVAVAVAYFFGMLEIVKMGHARVEQSNLFGNIFLYAGAYAKT